MDIVERLEIVEDTRRLMADYVRHADHHQWQDLADLFTPDGTFTPYKPDGSVLLRMAGRDQIAATLGAGNRPDDVLIHHLFSDQIDVATADSARGVFAMEDLIFRSDDSEPPADLPFKTLHGYGHYHAHFVRAGGSWSIAKLIQTRLKLDFTY
jgi:hypothetical protein